MGSTRVSVIHITKIKIIIKKPLKTTNSVIVHSLCPDFCPEGSP